MRQFTKETQQRMTEVQTRRKASSGARLSSEVRGLLGKRLRAVYASLVLEPIPERFLELLEHLEATEKASSSRQARQLE